MPRCDFFNRNKKVCVKKGSKFFRRTVTRNGTNYNSGNKVNRNWRTLKRCPLVLIDFFYMNKGLAHLSRYP